MFFTFQDKPLGVRKNFFLFARNLILYHGYDKHRVNGK